MQQGVESKIVIQYVSSGPGASSLLPLQTIDSDNWDFVALSGAP